NERNLGEEIVLSAWIYRCESKADAAWKRFRFMEHPDRLRDTVTNFVAHWNYYENFQSMNVNELSRVLNLPADQIEDMKRQDSERTKKEEEYEIRQELSIRSITNRRRIFKNIAYFIQ